MGRTPPRHVGLLAATLAGALAAIPLGATGAGRIEATARIEQAALEHARSLVPADDAEAKVEVGSVDRRLRLPACGVPLEGFSPAGGRRTGRITVGVRCDAPRPWKLYVDARIRIYRDVVVTRHPLGRGEPLDPEMLALERREVTDLSSEYFVEPEPLLGKLTKRALTTGTVLEQRLLSSPRNVRRGQIVVLVARTAGLEVRVEGKALADGARGERIRVRNARSQRIVQGVVDRPGVVHVQM